MEKWAQEKVLIFSILEKKSPLQSYVLLCILPLLSSILAFKGRVFSQLFGISFSISLVLLTT